MEDVRRGLDLRLRSCNPRCKARMYVQGSLLPSLVLFFLFLVSQSELRGPRSTDPRRGPARSAPQAPPARCKGPREAVGAAGRPAEAWGARKRAAWAGSRVPSPRFRVPWPDPSRSQRGNRAPLGRPRGTIRLALARPLAGHQRETHRPGGGRAGDRARAAVPGSRSETHARHLPTLGQGGGAGGEGSFLGPSAQLGGRRADSDQVRKKCAEPTLACVAVSRFLEIPIQNNLSETRSVPPTPPSRAGDQSGAPGYMRKQKPWAGRKTGLGRSSPPAAWAPPGAWAVVPVRGTRKTASCRPRI